MTGCGTITLKHFKIPFGAVEMTQKLKAHTVLPEVLVWVLCTHMRQLTIPVSPGNLPVSSSPHRHYMQCCTCVCSHPDTSHKDISFLPSSASLLPSCPPFLPPLLSHLSPFEMLICFFAHLNMDNKGSRTAVGIPAEAVGFPGSTLGGKEETMVL